MMRASLRILTTFAVSASIASCGSTTGSIGAVLGRNNETNRLYVREVPPALGAAQAGLLEGDEIVMVNGVFVRDMSTDGLRNVLRGDVASRVELTIVRGEDVIHATVQRTPLREPETKPVEEKLKE
jgi:C-terminal processing protease CtpA/Prc